MGQYRKPYIYTPEGWDDCWQDALHHSGGQQALWAAIGDSITQGIAASDCLNKSWLGLVSRRLREDYRHGGDFFGSWDCTDFTASFTGVAPFTVSATNRTWTNHGLAKVPYYSGTPTDPISFATPYECDALDVVYFDNNVGTFTYTLDGAAQPTVNVGGAFTPVVIPFRTLAAGSHALTFNGQSGTNVMGIIGVSTYPKAAKQGSAGVAVARFGLSGYKLQDTQRDVNKPTDRFSLWQGKKSDGSATGLGFPTQPHLATIALGINDCSNNIGLDQFRSGLRRYIQALRRGRDGCSILLIGTSNPDLVNSETTSAFTSPENWGHYLAVMRTLAEAYGCAFVSVHARWGELGVSKGFQTVSNGHPTDQGHADMADVLADLICA